MVSSVSVSGSAGAPGKALWRPSVNRILWGELAFPGHLVVPTCGAIVLVPARARKHSCSLVPAYIDLLACSWGVCLAMVLGLLVAGKSAEEVASGARAHSLDG